MSQERPGFLCVDTVHQGAWDGAKGVCHINEWTRLPKSTIRNRKSGRARETDPNIQDQRLQDTVREAEIAAGRGRLAETGSAPRIPGSGGRKDDRQIAHER